MINAMKSLKFKILLVSKFVNMQRIQVEKLIENFKKTIIIIIMRMNNLHDVLANVSMYATNQFSKLHI